MQEPRRHESTLERHGMMRKGVAVNGLNGIQTIVVNSGEGLTATLDIFQTMPAVHVVEVLHAELLVVLFQFSK